VTPDDTKPGKKRKNGLIIAMDGPAGVGKSTIGHLVAKDLGYHFINTGEMYRALTWRALEDKMTLDDQDAVLALAERIQWDFRPTDEGTTLKTFIDGQGVTTQIRDEKVSKNSSVIAANPGVRKYMCRLQRKLGQHGGIVMEGRDITTHVFPDADFKIYLDASVDERADRRYRQLKAQGHEADRQKIKEAILTRDLNDLKRKINPLTQAADAIVIDSTSLSMHEVAGKILKTIRNGR
jgi:cytidylate kinase